jgi:hypothetical protein
MGFVLGKTTTTSNKTTTPTKKKFILGGDKQQATIVNKPVATLKPVIVKPTSKLDVMEKRLTPVVASIKTPYVPTTYKVPVKKQPVKSDLSYKMFGEELAPINKEDTLVTKVGKGLLNYGVGTAMRAIGGGGEALAWLSKNIINVATGKPIDSSRVTPYELLPKETKAALDTLEKNKPLLGGLVKNIIAGTIDPSTYIGGMGVLDDLARAGVVGKSATLGTTENLLTQAKTGEKVLKTLPKPKSIVQETIKETVPKIEPEIPKVEPVVAKSATGEVPLQFKGAEPGTLEYNPVNIGGRLNIINTPVNKTGAFAFESPAIEKAYQVSKGVKQKTFFDKVKQGITDTMHMATRPIRTLPVTRENAELYKDLIRLPKIKNIVSYDTIKTLDNILSKTDIPDKNAFDIFSRKVLLDDLAQDVKSGYKLPNEFTPADVTKELSRLDTVITPEIQNAIAKRKAFWDTIKSDYIASKKAIGEDVSETFTREDYFHHQVLEYMNEKEFQGTSGTGKKLATPPKRGYMKERSGEYTGNINTDYLQAEYEVMAQMKYDTEISKIIKTVQDNYDIAGQLKTTAKAQGIKDWHELIPEGYDVWQPKEGNIFYLSKPTGEEVVTEALNLQGLDLKTIDPKYRTVLKDIFNDLEKNKDVLALGGKRREFVLKQEIVDTLNNLPKVTPTNPVAKLSKAILTTWKRWVLTGNPRSILKYNIRNFSGDLDFVIAADGRAIKKVPQAAKELFDASRNGKFTPELKGFYDRGGYQNLLHEQEIGNINKVKPFERFREKGIGEKIATPFKKYEQFTTSITNNREMVLRYSTYLDYIEQLKSGKLKNYGASKPEVINGLKSIEDKAYKLSNDALGAYDEVSEMGKIIRGHLIPFYSWMEVNFKRYIQLFKNTKTAGGTAKTALGAAAIVGGKVISTLAKVALVTGAMVAWNATMYPDLEETLPVDVKNKAHIILGKDKDGNTIYFSRLGALQDFLEWFGLENAPQDIINIINGKKTLKEQASDMAKSGLNKVTSGVSPFYKTPFELAFGKTSYPDVTKPGSINDKGQYVARSLGVQKEYDVLAGKPHRPYFNSINEALIYKADPEESAYWNIIDTKYKFLDKQGEGGGSFTRSKRSMALYNFKTAIRYGDKEAQKKYLAEYKELGGTSDGMQRSLDAMNPLYGIATKYQKKFMDSLTTQDKETLKIAVEYYKKLRANVKMGQ